MSEIISSNCNQRLDLGASLESFPYRNQSLVWDLATALRLKNSFNDKRHAAYKTYLQNSQSITRGQSKPLDVFVEELTLGLKIGQMRAFVKDSDAGVITNTIESIKMGRLALSAYILNYAEFWEMMLNDFLDSRYLGVFSQNWENIISLYCQSQGVLYHLTAATASQLIEVGYFQLQANQAVSIITDSLPSTAYFESSSTTYTPEQTVKTLRHEGYAEFPFKLKRSVVQDLHDWTLDKPCRVTRDQIVSGSEIMHTPKQAMNFPLGNQYCLSKEQVLNNPTIMEIARSAMFKNIASSYLGTCSELLDISCWWSFNYNNSCSSEAAQMYHFDMQEGYRWLKFFIYLNDCDKDNGPHTSIKYTHLPLTKPSCLLDRGYSRISDNDMFQFISEDDVSVFTGGAGTVVIGDTLAFHKGQPIKGDGRLLLQILYGLSSYPETSSIDIGY